MTLDLRVHHWQRDKKGRAVLLRSRPYVRLHRAGEPAVFIQGGRYYTDNGKELEGKVPQWVFDEIKLLNDEVKKEVGLVNNGSDKLS